MPDPKSTDEVLAMFKEIDEKKELEDKFNEASKLIGTAFADAMFQTKNYEVLRKSNPLSGGEIIVVHFTKTGRKYVQEFSPEQLFAVLQRANDEQSTDFISEILKGKFAPHSSETSTLGGFKKVFPE